LQNFNFHPDGFSSNGAPTAVKSRPTNTSQKKSINAFRIYAIHEGFTFGFPLHFEGLRILFYANYNLLSAEQNPEIVSTINGLED
jgi:hypothetical protein